MVSFTFLRIFSILVSCAMLLHAGFTFATEIFLLLRFASKLSDNFYFHLPRIIYIIMHMVLAFRLSEYSV